MKALLHVCPVCPVITFVKAADDCSNHRRKLLEVFENKLRNVGGGIDVHMKSLFALRQ